MILLFSKWFFSLNFSYHTKLIAIDIYVFNYCTLSKQLKPFYSRHLKRPFSDIDNKRLVFQFSVFSYEGGQKWRKKAFALIKTTAATKPTPNSRLAQTSKCLMLAGRLQSFNCTNWLDVAYPETSFLLQTAIMNPQMTSDWNSLQLQLRNE